LVVGQAKPRHVQSFSGNGAWLSKLAEPLTSKFGDGLTLCRDGDRVRWGFAGQSTIVELLPNGKMLATFVDREGIDAVSKRPAAGVYQTFASYALTPASCSRMVADMADFFSGVREPKFTFFDAFTR
jgi:hypothetical protein